MPHGLISMSTLWALTAASEAEAVCLAETEVGG